MMMAGGGTTSSLSASAASAASMRTPPPSSLLKVGSLVDVEKLRKFGVPDSEGGCGYVTKIHPDGTFDVKWALGGTEKNVHPGRVKSDSPLVLSARLTNANSLERPSLLSSTFRPRSQQDSRSTSPEEQPAEGTRGVSAVLLESYGWHEYEAKPNPLLKYLHDGRKKVPGWLRVIENEFRKDRKGNRMKQLTPAENNKLVQIKLALERIRPPGSPKQWPGGYTPIADLCHAYEVKQTKVRGCVKEHMRNNCSTTRKKRSDAGLTIFNSQKKRNEVNTLRLQRRRRVRPAEERPELRSAECVPPILRRQGRRRGDVPGPFVARAAGPTQSYRSRRGGSE